MRKEYKKPPIHELVIGLYFNPPIMNLRAEHIGIFWASVRDRFPNIQQQAPINNIVIDVPGEHFPMSRYWFSEQRDTHLLQIQRDAFLLNWRRRDEDYPHYDKVKDTFDHYYAGFSEFLRNENLTDALRIDVCELTYINVIEGSQYWNGIADTGKVIPSFQPLNPQVPNSTFEAVNMSNTFSVEGDLTLQVSLRNGFLGDDKKPVLMFEQRVNAHNPDGSKEGADLLFRRAHKITGACFNGLTASDMQQHVWGIKGDN